jgi:hypothetical protein
MKRILPGAKNLLAPPRRKGDDSVASPKRLDPFQTARHFVDLRGEQ